MADLVRMLALDVTNAVDGALGNAEVTRDEELDVFDLTVAATVLAGSAIAAVRAEVWRDAAAFLDRRGLFETRDIFLARAVEVETPSDAECES